MPVLGEIIWHKEPPLAERIPTGGKIAVVSAVNRTAGELCVAIIEGVVRIPAAVVQRGIDHIIHGQNLFIGALGDRGDTARHPFIHAVDIIIICTVELNPGHIVSRANQVLFDLFICAFDSGHNGNDGGNANDDAQHGQKRAHFMGPYALK